MKEDGEKKESEELWSFVIFKPPFMKLKIACHFMSRFSTVRALLHVFGDFYSEPSFRGEGIIGDSGL